VGRPTQKLIGTVGRHESNANFAAEFRSEGLSFDVSHSDSDAPFRLDGRRRLVCRALPAKDPSEGESGWAVGRMASMSGWRISRPDKHVRERIFDGPPGRHTGRLGVIRFSSKVGQRESNPYSPPSPVFYKLLKPKSQETSNSQESQAVCTKTCTRMWFALGTACVASHFFGIRWSTNSQCDRTDGQRSGWDLLLNGKGA
jgi:hypothetical protein